MFLGRSLDGDPICPDIWYIFFRPSFKPKKLYFDIFSLLQMLVVERVTTNILSSVTRAQLLLQLRAPLGDNWFISPAIAIFCSVHGKV